jgi:hypothetical protein
MISVEPFSSVIVVYDEAGIGIVEPLTTIADGELTGALAVVESGAIVIVVPCVTIVVVPVIDEPEDRAKVVVEPLGCVKVCTFELPLLDEVGSNVKVEPLVVSVVVPVIDAPEGSVKVTRP